MISDSMVFTASSGRTLRLGERAGDLINALTDILRDRARAEGWPEVRELTAMCELVDITLKLDYPHISSAEMARELGRCLSVWLEHHCDGWRCDWFPDHFEATDIELAGLCDFLLRSGGFTVTAEVPAC